MGAPVGTYCASVELEAEITPDLGTVRGVVRCRAADDGPLAVATYPRTLRTAEGLTDISRPWYYPHGFEAADMRLFSGGVELEGAGAWQPLGEVRRGQVVELSFETRVPRRNGIFGVDRHSGGAVAYLLAGWHPVFGREGLPLERATISYSVTPPTGLVGLVGQVPFERKSQNPSRGVFVGRYLPVVLAPGMEATAGDGVVVLTPLRRLWLGSGPPRSLALGADDDARRELLATWSDGRAMAQHHGMEPPPRLVVMAPLRAYMVESFDGGVAISDRAFHVVRLARLADWGILPREVVLRFHRLSMWRWQLSSLGLELAAAREADTARAELAADALAAHMHRELARERYGDKTSAPELLETFAIIPEIDSLIFAPQIPFVDTYFAAVDERGPLRLRLDEFAHPWPRGRLLYEKLVDRYGAGPVAKALERYVAERRPLFAVLDEALGAGAAAYCAQWLGPPPRLNYSLGEITPGPEGVRVEIRASGPDAGRLVESLRVTVEDEEGEAHHASRLGPGEVVVNGAKGEPARIELDEKGRLTELVHPPGEGPRYDNRTPPRWRFLLNNISGVVAVTNKQLVGDVDFTLRRIHDLRYRYDFQVRGSPEAAGVAAGLSYAFGAEVTPLRLAHRAGALLRVDRLFYSGPGTTSGFQGTAQTFYSYETRQGNISSFHGDGVSVRASVSVAHDEVSGNQQHSARLGASAFHLFPFASDIALLARVRADRLLGDVPAQLGLELGDRYVGGRGYERDEARSDRRALASLELRHGAEGDAATDLGGLIMLTGFEGAVFADAIWLPMDEPGCRRDTFYDVGYGVRFFGDILNVYPGSLAVDVGVPLVRCARERDRLPFTVYLSFVQSFFTF